MNLPRLKDKQYNYVEELARKSGTPLSQCPTCRATMSDIAPGVKAWVNGTYRLNDEVHDCDCDTQMLLRKHYLLANIGDQYQRLNFEEFTGSQDARDAVEMYLDKWETAKINGLGLEFSSPNLGVGKTFCATYVAKELVKKGEQVFFTPFLKVISAYQADAEEGLVERLRDTTVLVLDEVIPAYTEAQYNLFASKFEELVRYRTDFNRPTIMTTNLKPEELHKEYPRTYSLLQAKQIRVEMTGQDSRQGERGLRNFELLANDEVEPIT